MCTGTVKAILLPLIQAIGGDLLKYHTDKGLNNLKGEETGDFDLSCTLKKAVFELVWRNLPGRFLFGRFDDYLKNSGSKFLRSI